MAGNQLRANSLRIRFVRGSPEPSDMEVFRFMTSKMGLTCDKLLSMYKDKTDQSVIIKFKKEDDMLKALMDLPQTMDFGYEKHTSVQVTLSSANAVVKYVRLFNLPPEIEDQEIATVMAKFGKVTRLVREKYAEETGFPIWNSVRGIYLELKEDIEIPANVFVRNLRARVYYEGIVNKCFLCGSAEHLKATCPQKKSANERLQTANSSLYSAVLASGSRLKPSADAVTKPTISASGENLLKFTLLNRNTVQPTSDNSNGKANNANMDVHEETAGNVGSVTTLVSEAESSEGKSRAGAEVCVDPNQTDIMTKNKRERNQGRKSSGKTNNQMESENSTTDSDTNEDVVSVPATQLCESLDRVTRSKSKAKQMKMSGNGELDERDRQQDPVDSI